MCPYPDCKRHVGVGFSRKENLAEHLRRVHRTADADQSKKEASEGAGNEPFGASGTGKKRRRAAVVREDDDGGGEDDDEEDLEQEVKKLKKELREKDERLDKLEKQVQVLMRGHQ